MKMSVWKTKPQTHTYHNVYFLCSAEHLQAYFSVMVWTDRLFFSMFFAKRLTRSVIISNGPFKENANIYWNLKKK